MNIDGKRAEPGTFVSNPSDPVYEQQMKEMKNFSLKKVTELLLEFQTHEERIIHETKEIEARMSNNRHALHQARMRQRAALDKLIELAWDMRKK